MKLTEREQEIILEVAKGYDKHSLVAQKLGINLNTLNAHLLHIYRKTNTRNQIQLIRWAWVEAARCRPDENVENNGSDNGRESHTVQETEQPYAGNGSNRGRT